MTQLPEDILFNIGQYGGKSNMSDKRWYDELISLNPSLDLRGILALQRKWMIEDIALKEHKYYPLYEFIKDKDYDIYNSGDNAYLHFVLSSIDQESMISLLISLDINYVVSDETLDITLGEYNDLQMYLNKIIAHNLMKPTSFYLTYQYLGFIYYLGMSNFTIPYEISSIPSAPYEQAVYDMIKKNDPSFSVQEIYLWRYELKQYENKLSTDLRDFILKYKNDMTDLMHELGSNKTAILLGNIDDPGELKLPKGFTHDGYSVAIEVYDNDQSIFWGIISLLWNRQLFILDSMKIDIPILPYK